VNVWRLPLKGGKTGVIEKGSGGAIKKHGDYFPPQGREGESYAHRKKDVLNSSLKKKKRKCLSGGVFHQLCRETRGKTPGGGEKGKEAGRTGKEREICQAKVKGASFRFNAEKRGEEVEKRCL